MAKTWPLYTVGSFVISSRSASFFLTAARDDISVRDKGFSGRCVRMDAVRRRLARDGAPLKLPKTLDTRLYLVVNAGRVVDR